jgi:hypothetical protein
MNGHQSAQFPNAQSRSAMEAQCLLITVRLIFFHVDGSTHAPLYLVHDQIYPFDVLMTLTDNRVCNAFFRSINKIASSQEPVNMRQFIEFCLNPFAKTAQPHAYGLQNAPLVRLRALGSTLMCYISLPERSPIPNKFNMYVFAPRADLLPLDYARHSGPVDGSPFEYVPPFSRDAIPDSYLHYTQAHSKDRSEANGYLIKTALRFKDFEEPLFFALNVEGPNTPFSHSRNLDYYLFPFELLGKLGTKITVDRFLYDCRVSMLMKEALPELSQQAIHCGRFIKWCINPLGVSSRDLVWIRALGYALYETLRNPVRLPVADEVIHVRLPDSEVDAAKFARYSHAPIADYKLGWTCECPEIFESHGPDFAMIAPRRSKKAKSTDPARWKFSEYFPRSRKRRKKE